MALSEISVNHYLSDILINHGLSIINGDEFISIEAPINIKLKARSTYKEFDNYINSQLDVLIVTPDGLQIVECFGDYGADLEEAVTRNFQNFCSSTLHILLATFGSKDESVLDQVNIEEWVINNQVYIAYIGNISCKSIGEISSTEQQTSQFFNVVESNITSQTLNNKLHWFRGFYSQTKEEINTAEIVMDNIFLQETTDTFASIPIMEGIDFFSCRIFVMLKLKE